MQRRSFELQLASAAEETYAERIELGAITARTLVVVGEDDKADFRAIAARLADEIPDARARDHAGRDPPALARAPGGDRARLSVSSSGASLRRRRLCFRDVTPSSTSPPARRAESSATLSRKEVPEVHEAQIQVADDWFVGFHEGLKAKFWRAASEPWADDEAAAVAALLDLPAGGRVLDAPCGAGRIALRLAERGLDVTGVDISAPELEIARAAAAERGVEVRFEQGDVRELPEEEFEALVCWGNSFGYMPHAATLDHLSACRRALKEGGRLVLDTSTAAEAVLPGLRDEMDYDLGDVRMRARQIYDAPRSRIVTEMEFTAPGCEPERSAVVHHVYTVAELVRMLVQSGFSVEKLLGDPASGERFELGSARLVVLAKAV